MGRKRSMRVPLKKKVRCAGCGHWTERKMGRQSFKALLKGIDDTVWVCSPECWEKVFREKYEEP